MKNNKLIAGVDEVGRGCLAGPVVSAAVILKNGINLKNLKDSKKITFRNRFKIAEHIKRNSYFSVGIASVEEIFTILGFSDFKRWGRAFLIKLTWPVRRTSKVFFQLSS